MGLQKDDTVTAKSMKSLMSWSLNETTHLLENYIYKIQMICVITSNHFTVWNKLTNHLIDFHSCRPKQIYMFAVRVRIYATLLIKCFFLKGQHTQGFTAFFFFPSTNPGKLNKNVEITLKCCPETAYADISQVQTRSLFIHNLKLSLKIF